MIRLAKRIARGLMPGFYARLARRYSRYARLTRTVVRRQGTRVASGPFAGMEYLLESRGSTLIPKLLGSYEAELHEAVRELIASRPKVVVNIGCAEGYYAVGLARALPDATVYAYDIDSKARELCSELAKRNGVADRVVLRGGCDVAELRGIPLEGAAIICDCEGYELELLEPAAAPQLSLASLLVELHDALVPGLSDALLPRFSSLHDVSVIEVQERDPAQYRALDGFRPHDQQLALDEDRRKDGEPISQRWAYMIPQTDSGDEKGGPVAAGRGNPGRKEA